VKFILATTDPQKIPVTVLSRCLQFNLKQIPQPQIKARLQQVLDAENVGYDPAALPLIAHAAQGSLRDALSLLDQAIAHGGGSVAQESVRAMLGVVGNDHLHAILRALASHDGSALVAEASRMEMLSLSFESALQELGSVLHRLALAQAVPGTLSDDDPDRAAMVELALLFAPEDLQLYYQIAVQARSELGLAPDERAGFTMALLRMLAFAPAGQEAGAAATPRPPAQQRAPGAMPAAADPESKKNAADTAWPELVEQLGLTGMSRMLAQHCELIGREAGRVELRIAQSHQHLLEGPYQDRVRAALEQRLGGRLKLVIRLAENAGASPAAAADRDRELRQAQAIAAIEKDPFVRELVDNFDARIVGSSIKPIQ
jgi:DNA polymerase-3 subunit gamma/tau